jgi:adenine-specific DNA-methyltransferase
LRLRAPEIPDGPRGWAVRGDARTVAGAVGPVDLAYLDPPYNQHRYDANYHVWETLVAWDAPDHYGVACKRADLKEPAGRSVFNDRRRMPTALAAAIAATDARVVAVSCNDEGWVGVDEVVDLCRWHGPVEVLSFGSRRYVGSQIGIHNREGVKVGIAGRSHNVEHVVVAGDLTRGEREAVRALAAEAAGAGDVDRRVGRFMEDATPSAAERVDARLEGVPPPGCS